MFDTTISCLNRAEIKAIVKTTLTMTPLISQIGQWGLERASLRRRLEHIGQARPGNFTSEPTPDRQSRFVDWPSP
jgi:hypothetical protein